MGELSLVLDGDIPFRFKFGPVIQIIFDKM